MIDGKKVALVLSGGASYAAYEVGVVRALTTGKSSATNYRPLDADIFAGTSAGSFNASILVGRSPQGPSQAAAYLEDVWLQVIAGDSDRCSNGVYRFRGDIITLFSPGCLQALNPFLAFGEDAAYVAGDFAQRATRVFASSGPLLRKSLDVVELSSFVSIEPFEESLRETLDLGAIRNSRKLYEIVR